MTNARGYANARLLRLFIAAFLLLLGAFTIACSDGPDTPPGAVHVLTTDGDVNPIMERYIDRGLDAAEREDAAAVVIKLDTPGGLLTSMDDIIKRILESEVPVITYVWPSGGHAASAGKQQGDSKGRAQCACTTRQQLAARERHPYHYPE